MARETLVTCPSGLVVKFRSVKGKDLDAMRNRQKLATGEAIVQLLDACTIEVVDRGIYSRNPAFKWLDTLIGDQIAAIIGLREATTGPLFEFRIRCQDRSCREMIDWQLELEKLPRQLLSEESKQRFTADNVFETAIADTRVQFKLRTGADQLQLMRQLSRIKTSSGRGDGEAKTMLGLASRIVGVEGVGQNDVLSWLEELDIPDIKKLMSNLDAADCGVNTTIEIVCSGENGCGLQQEVELPLDATFFSGMLT